MERGEIGTGLGVEEGIWKGIDGLVVEEDIEVATGHDGQWKVRGGSHLLLLRWDIIRLSLIHI